MKIGIIGCGFIGTTIAQTALGMDGIEKISLIDMNPVNAKKLSSTIAGSFVYSFDEFDAFLKDCDLVIEAASQEAVREFSRKILNNGSSLMVLSVGALGDKELFEELGKLARKNSVDLYIPSGAVAGIDGLKSACMARIDSVTLTTTKPVLGLKDAPLVLEKGIDLTKISEPVVVFEGTADEAVKRFPKNINVAATLGIAGVGLERTNVKILADPSVSRNKHSILVEGRFGKMTVEVENTPSVTNPKTSYLAALSAIACLKKIVNRVWVGT